MSADEGYVHVDDVPDVIQAADEEQARRVRAKKISSTAADAATAARAKEVTQPVVILQRTFLD